jgi:hypothetical protein
LVEAVRPLRPVTHKYGVRYGAEFATKKLFTFVYLTTKVVVNSTGNKKRIRI